MNTTNQSQRACLRSVNHARAGSPPPPVRSYLAVPLPPGRQRQLSPGQIAQAQTVNNGGKATAEKCPTIPHVKEEK